MPNTIATNEFTPSPFPLPPPLHRWRTGKGERVSDKMQCSPITCMVAGATLNEESNTEALDTYTACGCEGASGASGLKNIIGGAAPFLIPFAAGFARRGVGGGNHPRNSLAETVQFIAKLVKGFERRGEYTTAAYAWLGLSSVYKRRLNDLRGELTALNSADKNAKGIRERVERDDLMAAIRERMANAYAGLAEYRVAIEKMVESLELSFSEAKYRRLVALIKMGVEAGHMTAAEGNTIKKMAKERGRLQNVEDGLAHELERLMADLKRYDLATHGTSRGAVALGNKLVEQLSTSGLAGKSRSFCKVGMPGRPERPTAIGRERGRRDGVDGKGRDGREDRGAEGQGRARKGLRVR